MLPAYPQEVGSIPSGEETSSTHRSIFCVLVPLLVVLTAARAKTFLQFLVVICSSEKKRQHLHAMQQSSLSSQLSPLTLMKEAHPQHQPPPSFLSITALLRFLHNLSNRIEDRYLHGREQNNIPQSSVLL